MTPFGEMLRLYRVTRHQNVREFAAEIGVSASTLSRIERGNQPDAATLLSVLQWATKSPGAQVAVESTAESV